MKWILPFSFNGGVDCSPFFFFFGEEIVVFLKKHMLQLSLSMGF